MKKERMKVEKSRMTKSGLAITLSKLRVFATPAMMAEQYPTDAEIAADVLWNAYMRGDLKGKIIADLGCGTGLLGIGALLMHAKRVYFVDSDREALRIAEKNIGAVKVNHAILQQKDVAAFSEKVDVVLQNPPFGTKTRHADRAFLEKAFSVAPVIYSFHKTATARFVQAMAADNGFTVSHRLDYRFPLKATMPFHRKKREHVSVSVFRLVLQQT